MKTTVSIALSVAFSICAFQAVANEYSGEPGIRVDSREVFETDAASVRNGMRPGGRYEYVRPQEQKTVEKNLDQMDALFNETGSVANMKEAQKLDLFNAREAVNSILTERDRLVCKKEAPLGSHIPVTTCHTHVQ